MGHCRSQLWGDRRELCVWPYQRSSLVESKNRTLAVLSVATLGPVCRDQVSACVYKGSLVPERSLVSWLLLPDPTVKPREVMKLPVGTGGLVAQDQEAGLCGPPSLQGAGLHSCQPGLHMIPAATPHLGAPRGKAGLTPLHRLGDWLGSSDVGTAMWPPCKVLFTLKVVEGRLVSLSNWHLFLWTIPIFLLHPDW